MVYDRNQRLKRRVSKPKEIFRGYNPQQNLYDKKRRGQPSDDEERDPQPKRTRKHSPRCPAVKSTLSFLSVFQVEPGFSGTIAKHYEML